MAPATEGLVTVSIDFRVMHCFEIKNLSDCPKVVILLFLFCRQEAFSPNLRLGCTDGQCLCPVNTSEFVQFVVFVYLRSTSLHYVLSKWWRPVLHLVVFCCVRLRVFCPFVVLSCSALSLRATIQTVFQCIIGSKTLCWNWTTSLQQ